MFGEIVIALLMLVVLIPVGLFFIRRAKAQSSLSNGTPPTKFFPEGLKPIKKRSR